MVKNTETWTLEHEFKRLLLGLEELKTIGRFFKNKEEDAQARLRIDVASANEEDTATFTDPELLSGSSLPTKIKSIQFSLQVHPATYMELSLPESDRQYAKATVQSNDELLASTLLDEVKAEVGGYEVWGKGLKDFAERSTGRVLFTVLCCLSILGVCIAIFLLISAISSFYSTQINPLISYMIVGGLISILVIVLYFFKSGNFVNCVLGRVMPPIEYMGGLAGGSSKFVKQLKYWIYIPLLAMILIVFLTYTIAVAIFMSLGTFFLFIMMLFGISLF